MDEYQEADQFKRMRIMERIARMEDVISRYREGIDQCRDDLDVYHHSLGRISQRLGESEPEEPR